MDLPSLLANVSNSEVAGATVLVGIISSTVGGAVVWLTNKFLEWRKERDTKDSVREKTITDHLEEQANKLEIRNKQLEDEIKAREEREQRAVADIMYKQGLLDANGIRYRPYTLLPTGDTDQHPSLGGGGDETRETGT